MDVKELARGFVPRFFLSLLPAPWVFVFAYFGHRCFTPAFANTEQGAAGCLAMYAVLAPIYMAIGPIIAVDEEPPPYGPHLWVLTALVLAVLWQAVAIIAKRRKSADPK